MLKNNLLHRPESVVDYGQRLVNAPEESAVSDDNTTTMEGIKGVTVIVALSPFQAQRDNIVPHTEEILHRDSGSAPACHEIGPSDTLRNSKRSRGNDCLNEIWLYS